MLEWSSHFSLCNRDPDFGFKLEFRFLVSGRLREIRHTGPGSGEGIAEQAPPGTVIGEGEDFIFVRAELEDFAFHVEQSS